MDMSSNEQTERDNESQGQDVNEGVEAAGWADQEPREGEAMPAPAEMAAELAELKGRLQRLGADYQNYQRRTGRQVEQSRQLAQEEMARSLLVALDNFEHTLEKGREAQDVAAVLAGVQIVYDHMVDILRGHGMERILVEPGAPFDPNLHQAMLHEPTSEYADQTVVRELAPGYAMNGRTLRPVKVAVAKRPAQEAPEAGPAETAAPESQENEE